LQFHLGVARRTIKLFRFTESFHNALIFFDGRPVQLSKFLGWLDFTTHTCNGMYLLLESITVLDSLEVPDLKVWDDATYSLLKIEAMRFWFLALVVGAVSSVLRLYALYSEKMTLCARQVKVAATAEDEALYTSNKSRAQSEKLAVLDAKMRVSGRKLVANLLDSSIPGSALGWISVDPSTIALSMFATSFITGYEVWKRCGLTG
jgi:hypothetical protein